MKTHTKESQENMTPEFALTQLVEGNARFVKNLMTNRNLLQQVNETSDGQYPFATILSCIDSRVSAELIFDQGIGDIFSIRIAGNILNDDILGSMEFASKLAGSKLIVVLGHTRCGAVGGAVGQVEMENLTGLLHKIHPAIDTVKQDLDLTTDDENFMDEVVKQNVINVADEISQRSNILKQMAAKGEIDIVKAVYSVDSGVVEFY